MKGTLVFIVTLIAALLGAADTAGSLHGDPVGALAATSESAAAAAGTLASATNDTYYEKQWALPALQSLPVAAGSGEIIVAVLDSGIDQAHEDLAGRVVGSVNFSGSSTKTDVRGHGTHVAGIVAANANNSRGIAGIAPGARLLNVKVAEDDGKVYPSRVARGITWAVDHGARIINMSLTFADSSQALATAVKYAVERDVIVIAAAGNRSAVPTYPSAYAGVIGVAALNQDGTVWSGSINNDYTDLYVPGAQIYSSVPGNKYDYKSGSSMAAAFATGLAANALGGIKDSNADGRISDELLTALQAATTGLKK